MTNTVQASLILYFYPERWVDEGNAAGAAQIKAHAESKVGGLLDQIDAQFASHGCDWFLGERFSVLDPFALMLCRWTARFRAAGAQPAAPRNLSAAHACASRCETGHCN